MVLLTAYVLASGKLTASEPYNQHFRGQSNTVFIGKTTTQLKTPPAFLQNQPLPPAKTCCFSAAQSSNALWGDPTDSIPTVTQRASAQARQHLQRSPVTISPVRIIHNYCFLVTQSSLKLREERKPWFVFFSCFWLLGFSPWAGKWLKCTSPAQVLTHPAATGEAVQW